MDRCAGWDIPGLNSVAGDAGQNEQVVRMDSEAVESVGNDLSGKREVLILKQQAPFRYATDERELVTLAGERGPLQTRRT